tara:strand:+ start:90 stop:368 length:279 start_codon:yes stop_codon:yes gene_type:complete
MKLSEKSEFTLDLKTIGIVVAMAVSVSSTYFTLKADIDENKKALERGNWVSATEYELKDEAVRNAIYSTQEDVGEIKEWIKKIDERIYNLNK